MNLHYAIGFLDITPSDVQRFVFFLSLNSLLEQFGNNFVNALVSVNGRHISQFGPIQKYPSGPLGKKPSWRPSKSLLFFHRTCLLALHYGKRI